MSRGKRAIFTIITVINKKRKSIKEKLRFVPKRRFEIKQLRYNNTAFCETILNSYEKDNKKALEKYIARLKYPVIYKSAPIVKKYRYRITLNNIAQIFDKKPPNLVLFDKNGEIIELLPDLIALCQSLYVSTDKITEYEEKNKEALKNYGSEAVICNRFCSLDKVDAVICTDKTEFSETLVFGEHHLFASGKIEELSCFDGMLFGKNDDSLLGAGLAYINGEKSLLEVKSSHFASRKGEFTLQQIKSKITA